MPALASPRSFAGSKRALPRYWRRELDRILISEAQIKVRVRQLAKRIEGNYRERELVIVALLNGTIMFLADLIRHLGAFVFQLVTPVFEPHRRSCARTSGGTRQGTGTVSTKPCSTWSAF